MGDLGSPLFSASLSAFGPGVEAKESTLVPSAGLSSLATDSASEISSSGGGGKVGDGGRAFFDSFAM